MSKLHFIERAAREGRTLYRHVIIFRVLGSDVYEIPVIAGNRGAAMRKALAFVGVSRADVIVCYEAR